MAHPLDGCIARLNRADVHIRKLVQISNAFLGSQPPPYVGVPAPKSFDDYFEFDVIGQVRKEPPTVVIGTVLGDAVNNLRAALDNLVWELTVQEQGRLGIRPPPDPIPRNSPWRKISFPIEVDDGNWPRRDSHSLWGIRPGLRTKVKRLQPFSVRKKTPQRHALAVLEELWNIDKHRHPHLGQWVTGLYRVTSAFPEFWGGQVPDGLPDYEFEIVRKFNRPFVDGARLGRVRVTEAPVGMHPAMFMQAHLMVEIAFDKGPPAYGGKLIQTLRKLHEAVSLIVGQFESEFP